MVKQLQKTTSKSLKFYIINSIKNTGKLPIDISPSKISYHLKPFVLAGLVNKKAYGVWEITAKGKYCFDEKNFKNQKLYTLPKTRTLSKKKTKKQIRGHGFRWQIKLPARCYLPSRQRSKLLDISGVSNELLKNGVVKCEILGNKTHLCERTINVWINKDTYYLGRSAKESYKEAAYQFMKVIKTIERYYNRSLKIRDNYKFKPSAKHFGDLNNDMALKYKKENKFLRIMQDGKEWLIIDFSDNMFVELETTDNSRNIIDMDDIVTPFFNGLRKDPKVIENLKRENEDLKKIVSDNQKMLRYLLERDSGSVNIERFIK